MQKKLMVAAIASAFAAPVVSFAATGAAPAAGAGSSTVQVFGTVYVEYSYADQGRNAGPGAQPDRTKVDFLQTPGSELGVKGEERLGGNLSAWYQCTSTMDVRGQGTNSFCSRNSALGLKGGFGNVFIGNWDTPFKRTIGPTNVGANDTGIWGSAFLLTADSTTDAVGANRTNFKKRQQNSINYDSPNFGGFQVMGAVTSAQTATATLENQANNKPRVWSLGLQYSAGPLYISGGYEEHREFAGAAGPGGTKDKGWHVGAAYTFGPVRFGGQYTEQRFDVVNGGEVKAKAWHAGVDWTIVGPHGLRAAYTQADDMSGPGTTTVGAVTVPLFVGPLAGPGYRPAAGGDTGAKLYQIRYVYTFSKRTEFNLGYVMLDNDGNAAYNLGGLNGAHANGEKQQAVAFAMRHTF